jgi:hypothetical protein
MILAKQRKKVDIAKYTPGTMRQSHSKSIKNNNLFHEGWKGVKVLRSENLKWQLFVYALLH